MDRATRMLDAAGELLLALGYRKVTVDDVARRAGVGKGTVYLHWSSKAELFATVLVRDAVGITRELLDAVRADESEVALHRTLRRTLLLVVRRPLTHALYTGDADALGTIVTDTLVGRGLVADNAAFAPEHFGLLHRHGLLADDPATTPDLAYRLSAATTGFFLDRPDPVGLDVTTRADALAVVVRRGFEPTTPPDRAALRAAAPELAHLYERLITTLSAELPEEEP